ncbi:hypothetical protein [Bartonella grahamii]|uniref:hypothetical protein n=1 Tax=Bartonella grahamii TaxID=33045 RepID=UPI002E7AD2EB|nr:hypothetical protein [Bartonella grahamii]
MRGNGKNASLDEKPRSFALEEAFLTRKNYKVIFCIAFIISVFRTVPFVPMLLEFKLTEWEGNIVIAFFFILQFIFEFLLIFILVAVAFLVRIIFTVLLEKKIDKLEQAIWQRSKAASQQKSA